MAISQRQLNRATLDRQLLLRREPLDVPDGVRRVLALQAQAPASPYVALFNRLAAFDPARLDDAFADGSVFKGTLMRITLHAVHRVDAPALHAAMQTTLRAGLGDPRFADSGLTEADADALIPALLEFAAEPRSIADCEAFLAERTGVAGKGVWWGLRRFAPLRHAPTGPPWSFRHRPAFAAAALDPCDRLVGVQHLIRRYLEAFGPATVRDMAQFAMLPQARLREALDGMDLAQLDGGLLDAPGATLPDPDVPAPPRLMAMWDSVLLAYADRSRVIPDEYRAHVARRNGDVLPTLLVDGQVAGVWRALADGIEATAFHELTDDDWAGLSAEAEALKHTLLDGREAEIYRRHHHWWTDLPGFPTNLV